MSQKNTYDYSPASQDELDSTFDNEDISSSPRQRCWSPKAIFANALLAFISILFLSFAVYQMLRPSSSSLLSPDSFFPSFPNVKMKFIEGEHNDFMRFDEVGDAAWNGMIPNGAGYVKVDRPRRYDMEPSVPYGVGDEDAEVYQASVVHQLHCLGTLRLVLAAYARNERLENYYDSDLHMRHCLNILRQGIICAADPTLAFSKPMGKTEDGLFKAKFTNIGTVHTCRSWDAVKNFLVQHRAMDWNGTVGTT
ncbi:hypothetical protein BU24DRAFT_458336 [Aaosphaeria arxii CBS 175.79]|uniref:Uncharacterized protein n=1 Tax=Aaosphaeria arxii CBS 175.79 TaxID=1450172 RepID=A0A6A5XZ58_9PLEO|nr:uncharacterized protein BU24DRAFT_458336 [Aaosphaeria arxii CBS 175.79]KAF2018578.1 hypothetical protein BU24DRAFT_458336 [Aaosphaeria arxii CBS 175.79]